MAKVLIDTSAWIEFFTRPTARVAETVDGLIKDDLACVTGVVLAELLCGTRTPHARDLLLAKFKPLTFLEATQEIWIAAGSLAAALSQRGLTLPLTDVLLAAVAQASHVSIYTTDRHFTHIPHVQLHPA